MTWLADHWLDILGWGGSALLVYSLLQSRVLRFRVLNLTACVVLVVFNGLLGTAFHYLGMEEQATHFFGLYRQ